MRNWRTILLEQLPRVRGRIALVGAIAAGTGILEAAVLVLAAQVAVAVSTGDSQVGLPFVPGLGESLALGHVLAFALVAAFGVIGLHVGANLLSARLASDMLRAVRVRALRAYGNASWARQERENEGSLQETVSSLATTSASLVLAGSQAVGATLGLLAMVGAALLVEPSATALVVVAGGGVFAILYPLQRVTRRESGRFVRSNSAFTEDVSAMQGASFELRSFGADTRNIEHLMQRAQEVTRLHARSQFVTRVGHHLYRDVALVLLVVAIWLLTGVDSVDIGSVGAVVLLMLRSLASAQSVNGAIHQIQQLRPNLEMLDERLRDLETDVNPPGHVELGDVGPIELRSVSYAYPGEGRAALDRVDLRLEPGEMLGVVGPSGAGKSTLMQILLRMRFPTDGEVIVGGVPLSDVTAASWQRLTSVVAQEPRLLPGTVADNISFFRDIPHHRVVEAAEQANLRAEIEEMPDGFAARLGPRGIGLSGGQKQRLAIARALAGNPRLLILDEPTSALDVHSEAALQRTIHSLAGAVSLVIIAHRLSTIASCDRLLILDRGRVAALGPQAEARLHPFLADRMT
jgi:ATP-binding cassette, subfamily B, bacterial